MSVSTLLSHLIGLKEGGWLSVRDDVSVHTQIHASEYSYTRTPLNTWTVRY